MKNTKHIDSYSLQYWLYAILNKEFGSEVKFERNFLHSQYSVNRHCFSIKTNTLSINKVKSFLVQKLNDCGYIKDSSYDTHFSKATQRIHGKESLHVTVRQNFSPNSKDNSYLDISSFSYWKNN